MTEDITTEYRASIDDIRTLFAKIKGLANGLARVNEAIVQNDKADNDPIDYPISDLIDDSAVDSLINEPIVNYLIIMPINGLDPPPTIDVEHDWWINDPASWARESRLELARLSKEREARLRVCFERSWPNTQTEAPVTIDLTEDTTTEYRAFMNDIRTLFVEIKGLANGLARVDKATVQNDEADDDPIYDPISNLIDDLAVDSLINEPIVDDPIIMPINGPDPLSRIDVEHDWRIDDLFDSDSAEADVADQAFSLHQNDEVVDDPIDNPISDLIDDPTVDSLINEPIVDDPIVMLINGLDPPSTIDAEHDWRIDDLFDPDTVQKSMLLTSFFLTPSCMPEHSHQHTIHNLTDLTNLVSITR